MFKGNEDGILLAIPQQFDDLSRIESNHATQAYARLKKKLVKTIFINYVKENKDTLIPRLEAYLSESQLYARVFAAEILGELGEDAHDAIPKLKECLNDENANVRKAAASSLKNLK